MATLYRHDPKRTGRPEEEAFDICLSPDDVANIRDVVADAVMEVVEVLVERDRCREAGVRGGLFDFDEGTGYEREIEDVAAGLGIEWPPGSRPQPLSPEQRQQIDDTLNRFLSGVSGGAAGSGPKNDTNADEKPFILRSAP